MKPSIFISYSRREVGFVDDLYGRLESMGYANIWLDYRSLVPGQPWMEQIYQGLMGADVILLVVSKASMASENVEMEWQRVVNEKGKRVILLIFEAVDLPKQLEQYEWVDFRGGYESALKELNDQLQRPQQEEHSVPQTGFKVPMIVWAAFIFSVFTAVMSLGVLWTLFVPFFLVPLPYFIFKRNFHYLFVQASLVMLPFALYLTSLFSTNEDMVYAAEDLALASIPFVIGLLLILRSAGMQRWGKPEAIKPMFSNHWQQEYPQPKPLAFFVEHAPQDAVIAKEMSAVLKANGHYEAESPAHAASVFTLISTFKNNSEIDCEKHIVYPVILQSNNEIASQISKVQWLDFRSGVRNLEAVAKLLNNPKDLLKALCIRPTGNQLVLPSTVMVLTYFIAFLAVVCIGSWFPYFFQYAPDLLNGNLNFVSPLAQLAVSLILFGGIAYLMGRQLVNRKGPAASLIGWMIGMALLGLIIYWQYLIDESVFAILGVTVEYRGYSSYYPPYLYVTGNLVMGLYLAFKYADLRRWFPAKTK